MRSDVVVLFADPLGPYPGLVEEWYDEARDAWTYAGAKPVVAHPPCGPWGRLAHLCRRPQDRKHAPWAVALVQRLGGVLEHPAGSRLWNELRLPLPGALPDQFGGRSYALEQVAWGHACRKPTWLYVVGVPAAEVRIRAGGEPTHQIWGSRRPGQRHRIDLKGAHAGMRRRTPVLFAQWLIDLASKAVR